MTLDSGTLIRSDLESKVLPELQKIAESLGVEGHQRLRKGALIQAIMDKASGDGQGAKAEPDVPFLPWARGIYDYNSKNNSKYDPEGFCLPPGGPRLMATPYPMEIIQQPEHKRIFMVFEGATHIWREIYVDGRAHPQGDALNPTYLGHAVGHWDHDTLVVDVVGFNENTWLDYYGHPHTDLLHVVERFTRPNKGTLHYEALIDDPGAYSKPWTVAWKEKSWGLLR